MARVVWKNGALVSIKLREDLYTIAQMEISSIMRFFDISITDGVWKNIDLNEVPELFRVFVGRVVCQRLVDGKIKDKTVIASQHPLDTLWLRAYSLVDGIHYKGKQGDFLWLGGELIDTSTQKMLSTCDAPVVKPDLSLEEDRDIIEKYEFDNMWGDDDLGDRLRRYFDTGINRDDLKFEVFPGLWNDRETLRPLTRRLPIPLR